MSKWVKAASVDQIEEGSGSVIEAEGKSVAVFNIEGKFHAIDNMCPHRGGPLGEGSLDGNVVTCPWHGWLFDVTTGQCLVNPSVRNMTYNVKTEGQDVYLEI